MQVHTWQTLVLHLTENSCLRNVGFCINEPLCQTQWQFCDTDN